MDPARPVFLQAEVPPALPIRERHEQPDPALAQLGEIAGEPALDARRARFSHAGVEDDRAHR